MTTANANKKNAILELLRNSDSWLSTNQISSNLRIHWYKTELLLNELFLEGKIERDEKGKMTFWRFKQNEEEIHNQIA